MDIEVLFEDNHLLFVNKPAGILTQSNGSGEINLEEMARRYIKIKYKKQGAVFLHAVHRLDRPVSGIVLFAKTSKALSRLHKSLRERTVSKQYLAICEGDCKNGPITLEQYLVHDGHIARIVPKGTPGGRLCLLSYHLLIYKGGFSLIQIDLKSGRYHQIRAQLAANSHAILGDHKYGSQQPFLNRTIALHHFQMQFLHPVTQKELNVRITPPPFWPMTINSLSCILEH
jgi:23S rRNA pseudouridine1911/1915/1917 synthase